MKALPAALAVAYPFLIFGLLQVMPPREVALCVAALLVLRWMLRWRAPSWESLRRLLLPALLVAGVLAGALATDDERVLLLLPVAMNLALLVAFAGSLVHGPPLVETFARLQVPDLPADEVRYCRTVTVVWCAFFVANGAVCAWLALAGPTWLWTLYAGLISYLLVGLLFAGEFVVRAWRFGRYAGTPLEPVFRRVFRAPPDDELRADG